MTTPDASIVVSLSTPRGSARSSQPSLLTEVSSQSSITQRDIAEDIDRLADELRRYDDARGQENRELADNVKALRDQLHDLSDFLHRTPSPVQVQRVEAAPAVHPEASQRIDVRVGGSSVMSSVRPSGPRELVVPASPQMTTLSRSTSLTSSVGSFMSSHHSDDYLLDAESYRPDSPPPWHSPTASVTSDDSTSSFVSSSSSGHLPSVTTEPVALVPPVLLAASPILTVPAPALPELPSSPSPSSASSLSTVRPLPSPLDLLGSLNAIKEQLDALWEGQGSTNHMLDVLRERQPVVPDNSELTDKLNHIEGLLYTLLNQSHPQEPQVIYEAPRETPVQREDQHPEFSESVTGSEDTLDRFRELLGRMGQGGPTVAMPVPSRAGPSLVQQLDDILSMGTAIPAPIAQHPPALIPFTYQPAGRSTRPRSASPVPTNIPQRPSTGPPLIRSRLQDPRNLPPRREPRVQRQQFQTRAPSVQPDLPTEPPGRPAEGETGPEQNLRDQATRGQQRTDRPFNAGPTPRPVIVSRVIYVLLWC